MANEWIEKVELPVLLDAIRYRLSDEVNGQEESGIHVDTVTVAMIERALNTLDRYLELETRDERKR